VVACSVWLIDSETDELVCHQATDPKSHIIRGWRLAPGEGLAGWVARTGESLTVPDARADERYFKGVDRETGLQLRSILTVPLMVKQNVIGVIQAVDTEVDRFDATDLTLLESLAASAAIAIENARLYDQVESYAVEMGARVAERTRELTEAYERLKELDLLKSKFVSDVSHELRTPVANIKLYLHLLERGKPENRSHHMDVLNDQCDRLVQLVEDILSLSRLELGKQGESEFTSVDLNAVIERAMAAHRPQAKAAGLELVFERGEGLSPVQAERNQLAQVVTNLVINAINYTPAGQVRVTTGLDRERKQVCLEVQDTGTGIKSEDMPYIFDRFYRGKDVGSSTIPGTGLGLAIVKEIVDLHGGSIDVESQEGEGSTFRVWLPLAS
jgi:signal transduction histidine kinase